MINVAPIRIIVRREMADTLNDWRILAPMFILTFALPLVMIAAASPAIDFIGDRESVITLIPFAMILVGFVPSSFSLIAALEAFVGERERNSLEALLSMPISDTELYLGKLFSSLLPPLLSSFSAMTVFAIMLRVFRPDLFVQGLNPAVIILVLLLIGAKAFVMVTSAVIISSHTTNLRAANLLASFVLLPITAIIQIEALLVIGNRRDLLWLIALMLVVIAVLMARTGLGAFNREEILSREHEQLNLRRSWKTFKQFFREYQPAGVPVEAYQQLPFSLTRFYRTELPAILREYRLPLMVIMVGVVVGIIGGSYAGLNYRISFLEGVIANVGTPPPPRFGLSLFAMFNNIRVGLLSSLLSLFCFGIFAFMVPMVAFTQVAFVANSLVQRGGSWLELGPLSPVQFLLAYIVPHGIIELPIAILCAAMGLRLGAALVVPPKGFTVGTNILWALAQFFKVWLFVVIPGYVIAGLIEGMGTTWLASVVYR